MVCLVEIASLVLHISYIAFRILHLLGRGGTLRILLGTLLSTLLGVGANVDVDLLVDLYWSLACTEPEGSIGVSCSILLIGEDLFLEACPDERQIVLEIDLGLVCGGRRHLDAGHGLLQSVDPVNVEALW